MEKLTYVSALNAILNGNPMTEEIREKLTALRDAQAKRNSADKKPTATQKQNEVLKTEILNGMEDNRLYTITELIKTIPACHELAGQKVSALMRQMVADGMAVRTEEKRKAYFSKA